MSRTTTAALLLIVLAAIRPAAADSERVILEAESGGVIQLAVPEGWQPGDTLILYNHGFDLDADAPDQVPDVSADPALEDLLLAEGHALAAHSYSQRGWALFSTRRDQLALMQAFRERFGDPGRILVTGGSLGGIVTLRAAEHLVEAGLPVAGALALCPPLGGARTWDFAADLKLVYDQVCAGVGGGEIDRGGSDPDWVIDYQQIPPDWRDIDEPEVQRLVSRVSQCTGVFLPRFARSSGMQSRLDRIMGEMGISDEDFFVLNMSYATFALSDLVRGPDKLGGRNFFDNRFVAYDDPVIDSGIERVAHDPLARLDLRAASDPVGNFADTRLLVIHSSRDELVVPEHAGELLSWVVPDDEWRSGRGQFAASRTRVAMVDEPAPAHCEFSGSELLAGLEGLVDWSDGEAAPDAAALQARCLEINDQQRGDGGRCGFAPGLVPATLDARIEARNLPEWPAIGDRAGGAWFDPERSGEGLVLHVLEDAATVALSWYSFAPDGSGEQAWIVGSGRIIDSGIVVEQAYSYRGGGFGEAFDPASVEATPWGRVTLWLEDVREGGAGELGLRRARLRYEGPEGWGSGERELLQLTLNGASAAAEAQGGDYPPGPLHGTTGVWFRGFDAPGDGVFFQVSSEGTAVFAWYAFDPAGQPLWLVGSASVAGDQQAFGFALQRPRGGRFGADFDPDEVQREDWGTATLAFDGCQRATLSWQALDPAFGSGSIALERLSPAPDAPGCAD